MTQDLNESRKSLAQHLLSYAVLIDGGQLIIPLSAFDCVPFRQNFLVTRVALKNARNAAILSSDMDVDKLSTQEAVPVSRRFLEKVAGQHFSAKRDGSNARLVNPDANLAFRILAAANYGQSHFRGECEYYFLEFPGTPEELNTALEKQWIIKKTKDFDGPAVDVYALAAQQKLEALAGVTRRQIGSAQDFDEESPEAAFSKPRRDPRRAENSRNRRDRGNSQERY